MVLLRKYRSIASAVRSYSCRFDPAYQPFITLNNGCRMPTVGLGTFKGFDTPTDEVTSAIKYAIDLGYRHIDGAFLYLNEKEIGIGIKEKICEGVIRREDMFVVSKLWNTYHCPSLVPGALAATLNNFGFDYLDLYLMHLPVPFKSARDYCPKGEMDFFPKDEKGKIILGDVDYIDTWKAMECLVRQGLTKCIGVSNFNIQQLARLLSCTSIKPVTNQVECHPYLTQYPLSDYCRNCDIVITAYSPLGARTHAFKKHDNANLLEEKTIKNIADLYGKTTAQVLIRYHMDRGHAVIPKSVSPKRIKENFGVFDFKLSKTDMDCIDRMDKGGNLRFFPFEDMLESPYHPFPSNKCC